MNSKQWIGFWVTAAIVAGFVVMIGTVLNNSVSPERRFVSTVHAQVVGSADTSDREILSLGSAVCTVEKETNIPKERMVSTFTDNGFTVREANVIIDAANQYLCGSND